MSVEATDHFTVISSDLERTIDFYRTFLDLEPGARPAFTFPGAWLYAGERAVLHVVAGRPVPNPPEGVLDHMAFRATGLTDHLNRLELAGVAYDLRRLPAGGHMAGLWQLFFHDPDGAKVELDFDKDEPGPRG
jgi:catechol 2,3-dioxygenase-like lactoylglutathione lyase family enzyme